MSKRFGRNQKRSLRQALKQEQERSAWAMRDLESKVVKLQKENHRLSFKQERLDYSEFDMESSLTSVCISAEVRRTVLNMRKFVLATSINRTSLDRGGSIYAQHIKKNIEHELCSYLVKHAKINEEVDRATGDLVVYASIIAESNGMDE